MANTSLLLICFTFCFFVHSTNANPRAELVYRECGRQRAENVSEFNQNYLAAMSSVQKGMQGSRFATGEGGRNPNRVYALAECMDDLSEEDCQTCFKTIETQMPGCFPMNSGRIYFDGCFLRVENYSFFEETQTPPRYDMATMCGDAMNLRRKDFMSLATQLINDLVKKAPENEGFAEGHRGSHAEPIYGLANCWKPWNKSSCADCLEIASRDIMNCLPALEARVLSVGCYLRYSDQKFANKHKSSSSNRGSILKYLGIIFGCVAICLLAIQIGYFVTTTFYGMESSKKHKLNGSWMDSDFMQKNLLWEYSTLERATDSFSEGLKIGQGGFGEVFMGTLQGGREIAIKRLYLSGRNLNQEIFNEINIIGLAQHQNLVRFLGCCFTDYNGFLVYEFLANRSLDLILFDPEKRKELDWKKRLGITIGTAEGLEYLHKNCQVQIVHRDIKASNILLDFKHRPKIADFGLASFASNDQAGGGVAIAGTLGYMAPEYLAQGRLTDKVDVYSYGVLVLEIVSGVQSNKFQSDDSLDTLVTITWKHFKRKTAERIIDSSVEIEDVDEVLRMIQIALLCTQEVPDRRPNMSTVLEMLRQKEVDLPFPSKPPFLEESESLIDDINDTDLTTNSSHTRHASASSVDSSGTFCDTQSHFS